MSKASIEYDAFSVAELQTVAKLFIEDTVKSARKLFGGFSGSNYAVTCDSGAVYVLKLCNGYSEKDVQAQARIQAHLHHSGLEGACFALPRLDDPQSFVSCALGQPAVLLTFVAGTNADVILRKFPGPDKDAFEQRAFRSIGHGLALLHRVSCEGVGGLRSFRDGGACDVVKHMDGSCRKKMRDSVHTAKHPFVLEFYEQELGNLNASMEEALSAPADFPAGILHGDPFLDNCLLNPEGEFSAWVDYEDVSVGPLLFDVACCVIGCCFRASDNKLNMRRLEALLQGYCGTRALTDAEAEHFVRFMRLTLLCNCAWRFANFHIDHREIKDARDAYKELRDRIVSLRDDATSQKINAIVAQCRSANARRRRARFLSISFPIALALTAFWR